MSATTGLASMSFSKISHVEATIVTAQAKALTILLTRRLFVGSLPCVALAGCSDSEKVTVRYRVIATIAYKGKFREASTVMECSYRRIKHSLIGAGGSTQLRGEALIFDLPGGKAFYILPRVRDPSGSIIEFYEHALLKTLGLKTSVGSLSDPDLERLKSAKGRVPLNAWGRLPTIVAFEDEKNPKTIFEVHPWKFDHTFPGVRLLDQVFPDVRLVGLDIEITQDPLTEKLQDRLPWLNGWMTEQLFERDGPGRNRAYRDRPIGFIINREHFFGR